MNNLFYILSFLSLILLPSNISAEIVNLTIRWDGKACKDNCNMQLERGFKRMPGAIGIDADYKNGVATMRWMPLTKFQFQNISLIARPVGVPILDVALTVRGTVSRSGNRITLSSIGDDTAFTLVPKPTDSKGKPNPNNYTNATLDPGLLQVLDNSEKGHYVITVTGKLLSPEQSPPNYLGVESIVSDAPSTNNNSSPKDRQKQLQQGKGTQPAPAATTTPSIGGTLR